jgi:hypothetical protein
MNANDLSDCAKKIIVDYVAGKHTAAGAAWELWHHKLTPLDDPRAGDVIVWAKELGLGIPDLPEIEEQIQKALKLIRSIK